MIRSTYPVYIAQPLDDQIESLLVVAHASKQEHHFWNQIALVAYVVRLCTSVYISAEYSDLKDRQVPLPNCSSCLLGESRQAA